MIQVHVPFSIGTFHCPFQRLPLLKAEAVFYFIYQERGIKLAKSKINQTIRKSVEGTLDLTNGNAVTIEVEDIGVVNFTEVFSKFDGEHVKVVVTVSNEGDEGNAGDGD